VTGYKPIVVPKRRLADEVHRQILMAISGGGIAPSERIVQEELAETLQISRTPVREALLRLEQEGILVTSGRGGFMLRQISPQEVRDIYEARFAIEGDSARVLSERQDERTFQNIAEVIRLEEQQGHVSTPSEYYEANKAIHRSFVVNAGNKYLLEMFDLMWNRSVSFHLFITTMDNSALTASLRSHLDLLDMIRTKSPDEAAASMRRHIADGLDLQLDAISRRHAR
jgi:DNA-binding GntR family transcriptional regulator